MSEQLALGRLLRDEGTYAVDQRDDNSWWRSCADQGIATLAASGRPFTADDVRALGIPDPTSPKAWGARFLAASRSGLIRRVGYVPSRRASVHAHPIAQWQGYLTDEELAEGASTQDTEWGVPA
jgi:hypothetical protein